MSTSNQENLETFLRITKTVADNNECPTPFHLTALFEEHELPIINELDQALEEAGYSPADFQAKAAEVGKRLEQEGSPEGSDY